MYNSSINGHEFVLNGVLALGVSEKCEKGGN